MNDNPSKLRGLLGVTQSRLAKMCNTAIGTVRKWDSGEQRPSGPSLRLLQIFVWLKKQKLLKKCLDDIEKE